MEKSINSLKQKNSVVCIKVRVHGTVGDAAADNAGADQWGPAVHGASCECTLAGQQVREWGGTALVESQALQVSQPACWGSPDQLFAVAVAAVLSPVALQDEAVVSAGAGAVGVLGTLPPAAEMGLQGSETCQVLLAATGLGQQGMVPVEVGMAVRVAWRMVVVVVG